MNPIYKTYYSRQLSDKELACFGISSVQLFDSKPEWLTISDQAWESNYSPEYYSTVESLLITRAYLIGFSTSNCPVPRGSRIVMKRMDRIGAETVMLRKWVYTGGYTACPEEPTQTETRSFIWNELEAKQILRDW